MPDPINSEDDRNPSNIKQIKQLAEELKLALINSGKGVEEILERAGDDAAAVILFQGDNKWTGFNYLHCLYNSAEALKIAQLFVNTVGFDAARSALNLRSTFGDTPLSRYAFYGKSELVNYFVDILDDQAANIIGTQGFEGRTPLHDTASNGDLELNNKFVYILGDDAARVISTKDDNDETVLHHAADRNGLHNALDIVRLFVDKLGPNAADIISSRGSNCGTPLHIAINKSNKKVLALFIASFGVGAKKVLTDTDSLYNETRRKLFENARSGALEILLDRLVKGEELTEDQYALCRENKAKLNELFRREANNYNPDVFQNATNPEHPLGKIFSMDSNDDFPFSMYSQAALAVEESSYTALFSGSNNGSLFANGVSSANNSVESAADVEEQQQQQQEVSSRFGGAPVFSNTGDGGGGSGS